MSGHPKEGELWRVVNPRPYSQVLWSCSSTRISLPVWFEKRGGALHKYFGYKDILLCTSVKCLHPDEPRMRHLREAGTAWFFEFRCITNGCWFWANFVKINPHLAIFSCNRVTP